MNEVRALSKLAFDELGGFPGGIRQIHEGIAQRAFAGVGPAAQPVKAVHDTVARHAYGAIGGGATLLGRAADRAMARRGVGEGIVISATRPGGAALAALNGLIGDTLEGTPLEQAACVRVGGVPVAPERNAVAAAFPCATPWPVVFLHGLMETEFSWEIGGAETYGSRLARDLGCTPVYLRYNTGRHISDNGRSVADLLESLFAAWPVEVDQVAIVGHSMGGLVARSACHQAAEDGLAWASCVRHIVSLGTPHLGAPLEQAVHALTVALGRLPETRGFVALLRRRSAGIRDLRHGSLVDEDWRDRDPEALRGAACREIPLLDGATHCFVSASLTRDERHPVGRLLGDALVLVPSASGRGRSRRIPFKAEHGMHVGATNHIALLNHPKVYERVRGWLSTPANNLA